MLYNAIQHVVLQYNIQNNNNKVKYFFYLFVGTAWALRVVYPDAMTP